MFKLKLRDDHRARVQRARDELAAGIKATSLSDTSGTSQLQGKRAELAARVQQLERGANLSSLEVVASEINLCRTQLELLDRQIQSLQGDRASSQVKAESELAATRGRAKTLLAEVAFDFVEQHAAHLQAVLSPYAVGNPGLTRNVIGLLPFFAAYRSAADNLRHSRFAVTDEVLLGHLGSALAERDFLAPA
jgi:hypothetical protein